MHDIYLNSAGCIFNSSRNSVSDDHQSFRSLRSCCPVTTLTAVGRNLMVIRWVQKYQNVYLKTADNHMSLGLLQGYGIYSTQEITCMSSFKQNASWTSFPRLICSKDYWRWFNCANEYVHFIDWLVPVVKYSSSTMGNFFPKNSTHWRMCWGTPFIRCQKKLGELENILAVWHRYFRTCSMVSLGFLSLIYI